MRKLTGGLLVSLVVATATTVCAGERPGAFYLSPFVGGTTFDGAERLETRPTFGLRLGYDFTSNWAAELTSNYTATAPKNGDALLDIVNYRLEGLYNFVSNSPLVPYLAVGGGGQSIILGDHNTTYATANVGAGIKYFFTDDVAFRADYHTNFIVNQNAVDRDVRHDYLVNYEYTMGLQVLFGGARPTKVAAAAPAPAAAPKSQFSAGQESIKKGEAVALTWSSTDATDCDIQPGIGPVGPQGNTKVTPSADTTYTLTCSGAGGTTSSKAVVAVAPLPPTSAMSALPGSITKGDAACLEWKAENATNCEMQPDIGKVDTQGKIAVMPSTTTSYTLTCSNAGGKSTAKVDVAVAPPPLPTSAMSASPTSIAQGETASLEWKAENVTKCEILPNIGPVEPQGSVSVTPSASTSYVLTCSSAGGKASSTAEVLVAPQPCPVKLTPEQEETVNLAIEFDSDRADIKPQFYPNLDALGKFMTQYPTCEVTVEGHTDNVGTPDYNMKLSQDRAEAVKEYLVKKFRIDPKMINTASYGETKPIDTSNTSDAMQKNRRVEVHHGAVKAGG